MASWGGGLLAAAVVLLWWSGRPSVWVGRQSSRLVACQALLQSSLSRPVSATACSQHVTPTYVLFFALQRTGLDSTAAALEQQLQQPGSSTTSNGMGATQQPLQLVRRVARLVAKRVLRAVFGWLHWRCCW